SSGGPFQATHLSAGKDGTTGKEAVFVNFNGAVYEHTGSTANAGWSFVAGVNLSAPHSLWQIGFAVSDLSASQVQGAPVFLADSGGALFGTGNNLTEYVGHATGTNTPLSYNSYSVASGVLQVSAGVDNNGHVAAFTLSSNYSLDEYYYTLFLGFQKL